MGKKLSILFIIVLSVLMCSFVFSQQGNFNNGRITETNTAGNNSEKTLNVQFGTGGKTFSLKLESNSTAAAIARYVGISRWQLPIYNYDESDVMQYYDIPRRYEIPDNSVRVLQAKAGDVFYSNPNRIILYYHDAKISQNYTKIGTFDATEEFISAVENNPVLPGWGNKLVIIKSAN